MSTTTLRYICTLTLIELSKLILGVYDELPQNDSWKVCRCSAITDYVENPWIYRDYIEINNLARANKMDADFVAVKIGDVNQSAEPQQGLAESQSLNTNLMIFEFDFEDQMLREGDIIELQLNSTSPELYGYQMTLDIPGFEVTGYFR